MGWAENSLEENISKEQEPVLYFGGLFSIVVLIHSCYLHKRNFKLVRILNDVSAITLLLECICFFLCRNNNFKSLENVTIIQNIFGVGILALILVICDTYLTFTRYCVVAGGSEKLHPVHKYITFTYFFILLFATWFPIYTFLPLFYDMNSNNWVQIQFVVGWVFFVSYLLYGFFYSGMVIYNLMSQSLGSKKLNILGINALGHTCCSVISCFVYTFYNGSAYATVIENILIVFGIHIYLNWSNPVKYVYNIFVAEKLPKSDVNNETAEGTTVKRIELRVQTVVLLSSREESDTSGKSDIDSQDV